MTPPGPPPRSTLMPPPPILHSLPTGARSPTPPPLVSGLRQDFEEAHAKILAAFNNACKEASVELKTSKEPNFDRNMVDQSALRAAGPAPSHQEQITAADDISTKLDFIENFKEDAPEDQAENFAMGANPDDYLLRQARQSSNSERKRSSPACEDQDQAPAKLRK